MESLPIAVLTALTPPGVDLVFHDDRLEPIPFDAPTDAVAIPVETLHRGTRLPDRQRVPQARRAGGDGRLSCHARTRRSCAPCRSRGHRRGRGRSGPRLSTTCGMAAWRARYHAGERQPLSKVRVDRRLFAGKRYLPIGLIETGRGCKFPCEFCAIQTFFSRTYRSRPAEDVVRELAPLKDEKRLFFFVDDNFAGDMKAGRELLPALAKLKVRWITQMSINAAHDEAYLQAMREAGCAGVLIGFESLDEKNLDPDEQALQHDARRLQPSAGQAAAAPDLRLRNLRLRLRTRHSTIVRPGGGLRHRRRHVHRRIQPPDAVSGHTPVPAAAAGTAAALRDLVARSGLSLQRPAVHAQAACSRRT
ncbi:MAG: radical SAM protein [Candidatus Moduliflexus flocculans]|nr:radical SAM protein [Candidatus Moduliflexus flocculans]